MLKTSSKLKFNLQSDDSLSYHIQGLEPDQYETGLSVFATAMEFSDEFREGMIKGIGFYVENGMLDAIGLFKDERMVGFGSLSFTQNNTWIPFVGILPECQGKGYGRVVMNELLSISAKRNRRSVELCATDSGFPLYEKLGFRFNYTTNICTIKEVKDDTINNADVEVITLTRGDALPDWVIEMDEESMGTNRKIYMELINVDEFKIIGVPNQGFGLLTGNRIGPLIASTKELANDIFKTALKEGIQNIILVEPESVTSNFHQFAELEIFMKSRKMTYGPQLCQKQKNIFALRSTAFG